MQKHTRYERGFGRYERRYKIQKNLNIPKNYNIPKNLNIPKI